MRLAVMLSSVFLASFMASPLAQAHVVAVYNAQLLETKQAAITVEMRGTTPIQQRSVAQRATPPTGLYRVAILKQRSAPATPRTGLYRVAILKQRSAPLDVWLRSKPQPDIDRAYDGPAPTQSAIDRADNDDDAGLIADSAASDGQALAETVRRVSFEAPSPAPSDQELDGNDAAGWIKSPALIGSACADRELHHGVFSSIARGIASVYATTFHGRRMADGGVFSIYSNSAASRTLPLGTVAVVTNLANGRCDTVNIRDRGPYVGRRLLDMSPATAMALGMPNPGLMDVAIEVIQSPTH
jgi:rare lipoprotein A